MVLFLFKLLSSNLKNYLNWLWPPTLSQIKLCSDDSIEECEFNPCPSPQWAFKLLSFTYLPTCLILSHSPGWLLSSCGGEQSKAGESVSTAYVSYIWHSATTVNEEPRVLGNVVLPAVLGSWQNAHFSAHSHCVPGTRKGPPSFPPSPPPPSEGQEMQVSGWVKENVSFCPQIKNQRRTFRAIMLITSLI